ncbi:MAG: hypothetical protein M3499_04310 [Actinomycetota bacterium]|nr:hypothetical protein [Actinomycetota bacterium]
MSGETAAVAEAVAKVRGVRAKTAQETRPTEIRRVRVMARDRAEQRGTTVEEEAPHAAEWIVKAETAHADQSADRKERFGLRFVEMERYLDKAKRALTDAVRMDVDWPDDERELLTHTLANVRSLLSLVDLKLTGSSGVDFDIELEKLLAEETR